MAYYATTAGYHKTHSTATTTIDLNHSDNWVSSIGNWQERDTGDEPKEKVVQRVLDEEQPICDETVERFFLSLALLVYEVFVARVKLVFAQLPRVLRYPAVPPDIWDKPAIINE